VESPSPAEEAIAPVVVAISSAPVELIVPVVVAAVINQAMELARALLAPAGSIVPAEAVVALTPAIVPAVVASLAPVGSIAREAAVAGSIPAIVPVAAETTSILVATISTSITTILLVEIM
jgi:hypothetical protein